MTRLRELWEKEPLRLIYTGLSVVGVVLAALGVQDWGDTFSQIGALVIALEGGRRVVSSPYTATSRYIEGVIDGASKS